MERGSRGAGEHAAGEQHSGWVGVQRMRIGAGEHGAGEPRRGRATEGESHAAGERAAGESWKDEPCGGRATEGVSVRRESHRMLDPRASGCSCRSGVRGHSCASGRTPNGERRITRAGCVHSNLLLHPRSLAHRHSVPPPPLPRFIPISHRTHVALHGGGHQGRVDPHGRCAATGLTHRQSATPLKKVARRLVAIQRKQQRRGVPVGSGPH
jgi:hypothetical protein